MKKLGLLAVLTLLTCGLNVGCGGDTTTTTEEPAAEAPAETGGDAAATDEAAE